VLCDALKGRHKGTSRHRQPRRAHPCREFLGRHACRRRASEQARLDWAVTRLRKVEIRLYLLLRSQLHGAV